MLFAYMERQVDVAYPTIHVRVINRNGYTLKIHNVTLLIEYSTETLQDISSSIRFKPTTLYSATITSNDFNTSYSFPACPAFPFHGIYIVTVEDANGNVVESTSIPYIGDGRAVRVTFQERVSVVYVSPFFVINMDANPNEAIYIPTSDLVTTIIKGDGWIRIYRGSKLLNEVSGESAIINIDFKIHKDIAYGLATAIDDRSVMPIVMKLPLDGVVALGAIAYIKKMIEDSRISVVASSVSFDGTYYTISASLHIDLHSSFDWRRVLMFLSGVAAVVAGGILLAISFGVSIPASVYMVATGVSLVVGAIAIGYALADKPSEVTALTDELTNRSIQEVEKYVNNIEEMVNKWINEGRITKDEGEKVKDYLSRIKDTHESTVTTLRDMLKSCIEEGKRKMYPWIATAGFAGVLVGVLLSPRIHGGGGVRTAGT